MTTDMKIDMSTVEIPRRPAKIARTVGRFQFEDLSDSYKESSFGQIDFEKQYASVYFIRLETLREAIIESAKRQWVESGRIALSHLVGYVKSYKAVEGDIVLVGVLFKEMCLKPNVLDDIQNNLKISEQFMNCPSAAEIRHQISETDVLYLEDMEARLQLVFSDKSKIDSLPTGLVVAVLGRINSQGFFEVKDITLPGALAPQPVTAEPNDPAYVALISGLQIGSPKTNPLVLQLLRDYLMGLSISESERNVSSKIVRVVIAGDTLTVSSDKDPTASALAEADTYLAQIASVVPVSLMSGPRDPVNYCLPQQPLHSGLLPEARRYGNLTVHTNPFRFKLGNMVFLGTSGQNVSDVVQFTNIDSALDALDLIVQARYLAPTAPDTLGSYPFTTLDPFVLQNNNDLNPHVVFAGNQPENAYKLLPNGNLMIATVSNFSIRPEILLVNVNDIKDVRRVRFDVQDSF